MTVPLTDQLRKFLVETNAIALAIGVVVAGAVSKLVATLVSGFFMPIVGSVTPGGEWRTWRLPLRGDNAIQVGEILGVSVDFLILTVVVFWMATKVFRIEVKKG
jgi:large conductance mechanosensitive channel protein